MSIQRVAALDGLRAVSVLLVVLGHLVYDRRNDTLGTDAINLAFAGVTVFFVLSGYLITTLLVREEAQTGRVDLRAFYLRRTLRIWPAFYVYLGTVGLLMRAGVLPSRTASLLSAGVFARDYFVVPFGLDPLNHTWSLAVEEQFYLAWPVLFLMLTRKGRLRLAIAAIVTAPLIRMVSYVLNPAGRETAIFQFHNRADSLMTGCLIALLLAQRGSCRERLIGFAERVPVFIAVSAALVCVHLQTLFHGRFMFPAGYTILNTAVGLILLKVALGPTTVTARMLSVPLARHLGRISFSIYLWQQLFVVSHPGGLTGRPWLQIAALLLAAEASYYLVEQPALKLSTRFARAPQRSSVEAPQ